MTHHIRAARWFAAMLLFAHIVLVPSRPASQSNNSTTFSGRATVIKGTIAGVDLNLSDTGALEPSGGARENSLLCYPQGPHCLIGAPDATGGALSVEVLHASTVGRGAHSRSAASVAEVSLTVGGVSIEADLIRAVAQAACQAGVAAVTGASELVNLLINDVAVVTGSPNQNVSVGPVTIVLNEQLSSSNGGTGDITVNALHVQVAAVTDPVSGLTIPATDLIVAQAHADIQCGHPSCSFADKVTGGGFVFTTAGDKLSFADAGKNSSDWGHFVAVRHGTKDRMKATALTTTFNAEGFAVITGTAQVNGAGAYDFTVKVKDKGEPGAGHDQFELVSRYPGMNVPPTTLGGGNIQFHKPCKVNGRG